MNLDVVFGNFPKLETECLVLRELNSDDMESLFTILSDEKVTQFYDDEVFTDISQTREQIQAWTVGFQARRCIRWGIAQRESG